MKPWHITAYDENLRPAGTTTFVGEYADAVLDAERFIDSESQWSYRIEEIPEGPATIETYAAAPEVWCDECGDLTRFDSWTDAEEYRFQHNRTQHGASSTQSVA